MTSRILNGILSQRAGRDSHCLQYARDRIEPQRVDYFVVRLNLKWRSS
jgi:hypothetical protein